MSLGVKYFQALIARVYLVSSMLFVSLYDLFTCVWYVISVNFDVLSQMSVGVKCFHTLITRVCFVTSVLFASFLRLVCAPSIGLAHWLSHKMLSNGYRTHTVFHLCQRVCHAIVCRVDLIEISERMINHTFHTCTVLY
jgi:hypothetical protein